MNIWNRLQGDVYMLWQRNVRKMYREATLGVLIRHESHFFGFHGADIGLGLDYSLFRHSTIFAKVRIHGRIENVMNVLFSKMIFLFDKW